ncbi:MAG: aldehyde dehydrogenase family protein [Deltaproteobacteria bacterium]|nr:aldehyde dehydrogenase family protein [Deltaproteobacteria bacterium]
MQTVRVRGDYIGGSFVRPRRAESKIISVDPGDSGYRIGTFPVFPEHVDEAVEAARAAFGDWRRTEPEERAGVLRKFAAEVINRRDEIQRLLIAETGKTRWEAEAEVSGLESRVESELREGVRAVSPFKVSEIRWGVQGRCWYRPLGVTAVLGSASSAFSLPCGHIIPALLAGNPVVFKPSKLVPGCGQLIAEIFDELGMPPGVFNLVQGDGEIGLALVRHPATEAILFTGSSQAGRRILIASLDQPHKMVALTMGGVNVSLVLEDADLERAVYENAMGSFSHTGQAYSSTGVILVDGRVLPDFAEAFVAAVRELKVGYGLDPDVFMGPMLSRTALERALDRQAQACRLGGRCLLSSEPLKMPRPGFYISPAVLAAPQPQPIDVIRPEGMSFGPDVMLMPVASEQQAVTLANSGSYPFCASIFTEDSQRFAHLAEELRFGLVNHNLATTEISMRLPLGGLGQSGNHRPAGLFAQRNCCYPVSSLQASGPFDRGRLPKVFPAR